MNGPETSVLSIGHIGYVNPPTSTPLCKAHKVPTLGNLGSYHCHLSKRPSAFRLSDSFGGDP